MAVFFDRTYVAGYPVRETHRYAFDKDGRLIVSVREVTDFGRDQTDETRHLPIDRYLETAPTEGVAALKLAVGSRVQWDD